MTRALPEPSFRRFAAGVGTLSLRPFDPAVLGEQALAAHWWGVPGRDAWRRALSLDPPRGVAEGLGSDDDLVTAVLAQLSAVVEEQV